MKFHLTRINHQKGLRPTIWNIMQITTIKMTMRQVQNKGFEKEKEINKLIYIMEGMKEQV